MTDPIALFLPVFTPNLGALLEGPDPEATAPDAGAAPDFSMDEPEPGFPGDGEGMAEPGAFEGAALGEPVEDEAVRIARAREEALAEAAMATEAALAAQAADFEARHGQALADERRRWAEEEGAALGEGMRQGLAALEQGLAESVAEILRPVLDRAMRAQAAEDLRAAVAQILATPHAPVIRIAGPADLVEPLRSVFASEAAIEIAASDAAEVTVEAGDTTLKTRLQAWAATLESHLGEGN